MRWEIQGTDAASGQSLWLQLDAADAAAAVHAAHRKHLIVASVGRLRRHRAWIAQLLLAVTAATLTLSVLVLDQKVHRGQETLASALAANRQLIEDLHAARSDLAAAGEKARSLEQAAGAGERQLASQLRDLRQELARTAADRDTAVRVGHEARDQASRAAQEARALTGQLEAIRKQLASAEARHAASEAEASRQRRQFESDLKAAAARERSAESRFAAVDAQLKAAQASEQQLKAQVVEASAAPRLTRYALASSFDQASDFMALHFGKRTGKTVGEVTTFMAPQEDHANILYICTDSRKEKVFDATLQVCLAPETPKAILADNQALLGTFAGTFAPSWKGADAWLTAATARLAGQDASERAVLVTDAYRVTVFGSKAGLCTVKIEPVQNELKDASTP